MFLPPYIFAKLGWGGGVYGCFFCVHRASAYRPFFFYVAGFAYVYTCVPRDKACTCQYPRDRISTGRQTNAAGSCGLPGGIIAFLESSLKL